MSNENPNEEDPPTPEPRAKSAAAKFRDAVAAQLRAWDGIPQEVEVFARKERDLSDDIDTALSQIGICLYVMPPLPLSAEYGTEFIFFSEAELRVRVMEVPLDNETDLDAYDAVEEIARCLHWSVPLDEYLEHPMSLAEHPVEIREDSARRIYDVKFILTYSLPKAEERETEEP